MSRKILIAGAGQAGLMLALGLQQHGYDVTVMSANTPEEVRTGRVRSTQAMFAPALQHESDLGLDFWRDTCPEIDSIQVTIPAQVEGMQGLSFLGRLDGPCQSVDQRLKMSHWLLEFARLAAREDEKGNRTGRGHVIIGGATAADLAYMSEHKMYDLIIVASGRGELGRLFDPDFDKSPNFDRPRRHLSVTYVHGMKPGHGRGTPNPVSITLIPEAGELFVIPALTITGPCHILFFEAILNGPLDRFRYRFRTGTEHLQTTLELMREYAPAEYQRAGNVKLTDWGCTLTGQVNPVVRRPVGRPRHSGGSGIVLGMADAVVVNDPITGQGANNAAWCARIYLDAILEHEGKPFGEEWMKNTFAVFWQHAQYSVMFSNAFLGPLPPHVSQAMAAAAYRPEIANEIAGMFARPRQFTDLFGVPDRTRAWLAACTSRT